MFTQQPDAYQFLISLFISTIFAFICANVAEKKGRSTTAWFIWGMLFSFFALIVLFFLPSLKGDSTIVTKANKEPLPDILSQFPETVNEDENKLWYYLDTEHQQQGPVSIVGLRELWNTGLLTFTSLVWSEGMKDWTKVDELPKLKIALQSIS